MYDYTYYSGIEVNNMIFLIILIFALLFLIGISIFEIICVWKIFKKCEQPRWASLIPIYNIIIFLRITELPLWYIILFFIPGINIYVLIILYTSLARKFNKQSSFALGLIFLNIIFIAILAFEKQKISSTVNGVNDSIDSLKKQSFNSQAQSMNPSSVINEQEKQNQIIETNSLETIVTSGNKVFCTGCGKEILKGAKFCVNCGKQVQ